MQIQPRNQFYVAILYGNMHQSFFRISRWRSDKFVTSFLNFSSCRIDVVLINSLLHTLRIARTSGGKGGGPQSLCTLLLCAGCIFGLLARCFRLAFLICFFNLLTLLCLSSF